MAQASLRPPPNLQPRPKAVPTFSSTSIAASSTTTLPQGSRPSSNSRQSSPARPFLSSDVSNKATSALIRRVLCPHSHAGTTEPRPIHELLPPLTSNNETDLQLYAIIAIVIKDLVQSWYGKITADQSFVEEVVRIIAHCTTQLETRLRNVDLESLLFDEIPELIEGHVNGWHALNLKCRGNLANASYQHTESVTKYRIPHSLQIHESYTTICIRIRRSRLYPTLTVRRRCSSSKSMRRHTDNS